MSQAVYRSGDDSKQPVTTHEHAEAAHQKGRKMKWSVCGKGFARTQKKGKDRSFIEGCLFALCCCWICDACFDVSVVAG